MTMMTMPRTNNDQQTHWTGACIVNKAWFLDTFGEIYQFSCYSILSKYEVSSAHLAKEWNRTNEPLALLVERVRGSSS